MKENLTSKLYIVTCYKPKKFVARFVVKEGLVQTPSPVLGFMRGWTLSKAKEYIKTKDWSIRESKRE